MGRQGRRKILLCLLDVPSGALRVSGMALPERVMLPLIAGMCGFGGICVIAQSLGALKGCGVKQGSIWAFALWRGCSARAIWRCCKGCHRSEICALDRADPEKSAGAGGLIASILAIPMLIRRMKSNS